MLFKIKGKASWGLATFLICILFIGSYVEAVESQTKSKQKYNELEVEGLTYIYEAVPVTHPVSKEVMYYWGKITIRDKKNKDTIYYESNSLQPDTCGQFPVISKKPFKSPSYKVLGGDPNRDRWLVILCGSSAGRHTTLKIFFNDPSISLRTTSIHIEDTVPNFSDKDGDGIYETRAYRRVLLEGEYGTVPYLTIYELNVDSTIFGFVPVFGNKVVNSYFDYYARLKKSFNKEIASDYIGPMVAALLATQDKDKTCNETKILYSMGLAKKDLKEWAKRMEKLGYP